jgi:predicted AAA+ superfamily ATPase
MDVTHASPEQSAQRIVESYPFHPAIRDLYARFKENPGFQQTRGLIRLMRIVASRLWQSGEADQKYLIAAHDLELNDRETLSGSADQQHAGSAISHDMHPRGSRSPR